MFVPHDFVIALIMMIASAVCWGSWANTYKGVRNYRFELFYWDYALGIFLISLVLAFTMGSTADDPSRFLTNVHNADNSNIASTMFAGVIFNLANLLLVAAIDMAGMAIAFPVAIGIALVVGVVSSYILQPKGHAGLLAAGVVCALVAVILDGKAYGSLPTANRAISRKSIVTCVVSGILMGALCHALHDPWKYAGPLQRGGVLNPGGVALMFRVERLFHEASAGWPAGKLCGIFSRTSDGSCSWFAGRVHLGNWYGVQSGGCAFHRCSDLVCHRSVRADGCGAMGRTGVEGISRREPSGLCLSGGHVCVLSAVHPGYFLRKYSELISFIPGLP
jgi:hypothetical protein